MGIRLLGPDPSDVTLKAYFFKIKVQTIGRTVLRSGLPETSALLPLQNSYSLYAALLM
jgi:hypothetical protein